MTHIILTACIVLAFVLILPLFGYANYRVALLVWHNISETRALILTHNYTDALWNAYLTLTIAAVALTVDFISVCLAILLTT